MVAEKKRTEKRRQISQTAGISNAVRPQEAHAIIDSAPDEKTRLLLLVMWHTGARVSEVLALKPLDILPPDRLHMLNEKQHKVAKGEQRPKEWKNIYVPTTLVTQLQQYTDAAGIAPRSYIFEGRVKDKPMSRTTVWRLTMALSKLTERSRERSTEERPYYVTGLYPHLWRHGYAVNLMDQGVHIGVVQRQLGHKSLATTSVYAEVSDGVRRDAVQSVRF